MNTNTPYHYLLLFMRQGPSKQRQDRFGKEAENFINKDIIFLLLTGFLLAAYLYAGIFTRRYTLHKALHNIYYLMGFAVLLVSGLLLIFLGLGILASPLRV
jgi:hypothetical protein